MELITNSVQRFLKIYNPVIRRGTCQAMLNRISGPGKGEAISHLSRARQQYANERPIEHALSSMFSSLEAGPIVAQSVGAREADIHVTAYNAVIEVKATGKANPASAGSGFNETQEEQLHDYVTGLRNTLKTRDVSGISRKTWVGILSDGQSGWVWKWGNNFATEPKLQQNLNWKPQECTEVVFRKIDKALGKPKGKQWAPGDGIYDLFKDTEAEFQRLYQRKKNRIHTKTKYELWLNCVRVSGFVPKSATQKHELFVKHSFLVTVAKAVIDSLEKKSTSTEVNISARLNEGFTGWIAEDEDGIDEDGIELCNELFAKARKYDWVMPPGDVLRHLYQDCIPQEDRKIYGEYYTPDWPAEQLTEKILDDQWIEDACNTALKLQGKLESLNGVGVLDPTCGSGTFLYHAAVRIGKAKALQNVSKIKRGRVIASLVHGIDIHPVAVEMSKATLLRGISTVGSVSDNALDIVQGDSLIVDREIGFWDKDIRIKSPLGKEFIMQGGVLDHPEFIHAIPKMVDAAKHKRAMPKEIDSSLMELLTNAHETLKKIIDKEGDSVWSHHILNMFGPYRISKQQVDRILANPPWVRASTIQEEQRKNEVENLAKEMGIWPGGKNATGFDIAALFIKRCRDLYLCKENSKACWIVNNAAIRAGNWKKFREWQDENFELEIHDYQKLNEQPFTGASSCALLELSRTPQEGGYQVSEWVNSGLDIIKRTEPWNVVKENIHPQIRRDYSNIGNSDYIGKFTQGTTIVPHCLVVIDKHAIARGGGKSVN